MKLYRPLKSDRITQPFGVNYLNFYAQLGLMGHNGIDWIAQDNEPVYFNFAGNGEVIELCDKLTAGLGVTVMIKADGKYYKIIFWHLKSYCVKEGQILKLGDLIGYADNTGTYTTGTHLHFALYGATNIGATTDRSNGYGGAIDPQPYYTDVFAPEAVKMLNQSVGIVRRMIELLKQWLGK